MAVDRPGPVLRELAADSIFVNTARSLVTAGRLHFQEIRVVRPEGSLAAAPSTDGSMGDEPSTPGEAQTASDAAMAPGPFDLRIDALDLSLIHI